MMTFRRALVLSPHPDDAELGMWAYMRAHPETAFTVVTLSGNGPNDPTAKEGSPLRLEELEACYKGMPNVTLHSFPGSITRLLESDLAQRIEAVPGGPYDAVFTVSSQDSHVEHGLVYRAAEIVCRASSASLLCYRTVSALEGFTPNCVFPMTAEMLAEKTERLQSSFLSQEGRWYFTTEGIRTLHQSFLYARRGVPLGEQFHLVRGFLL